MALRGRYTPMAVVAPEGPPAADACADALRRAEGDALRAHELVACHTRLHELIARDAPLSEVLEELVVGIENYEPSVIPCVVLLNRESNTLHPGAGPSLPPAWLSAIDGVVIGPHIGSCGSAAWSGELVITEDIATDPKWAPVREFAMQCGLRHCWSMPIAAADGGVLGTFALYGPEPRRPLPEHLSLLQDGARLAGIAIERRLTMEKLIHDARHDGLTGLPNRRAIFDQLEAARTRSSASAVLFVDLDGLKAFNDSLGHDRADEMIREDRRPAARDRARRGLRRPLRRRRVRDHRRGPVQPRRRPASSPSACSTPSAGRSRAWIARSSPPASGSP